MSDRLRLEVILDAVDRLSAPLNGLQRRIGAYGRELGETRQKLERLQRTQDDVSSFREQANAARETERRLEEQRRTVAELAREIENVEAPTREMTRAFERAKTEAGELSREHDDQRQSLEQLRRRLRDAGVSTESLARHERELRGDIEATTRSIDEQRDRLRRLHDARRAVERADQIGSRMRSTGASMMMGGAAMSVPLIASAREAMEYEDSIMDVSRSVEMSRREMQELERSILNLSANSPMAADGVAQIVAAAGRAGIPNEELISFAESALRMGVAFNLAGEDAGETMTIWRQSFRMNQQEVIQLADQINALSDSFPGEVGPLAEITTRIGATAENAGVAASEVAAMASMLNSMDPHRAATGVRNMLLTLSAGEAATNSQREAFDRLGLDAVRVSRMMQEDAQGTIMNVLQAVRRLPEAERSGVLMTLFGRESIDAVSLLANNVDGLGERFRFIGDEAAYAGSMTREYERVTSSSSSRLRQAWNQIKALAIRGGAPLAEAFADVAGRVSAVVDRISQWADENPRLAATISRVLALAAILLVSIGGLTMAVGALLAPLAMLGYSLTFARIGLTAIAAPLGRLRNMLGALGPRLARVRALFSGLGTSGGGLAARLGALRPLLARIAPLLLRIAGPIGLVITAFLALRNHILPILGQLWDAIRTALGPAVGHLFESIGSAVRSLASAFQGFAAGPVGQILTGIADAIGSVLAVILRILGAGVIGALTAAIEILAGAFQLVGDVINVVVRLLSGDFSGAWEAAATLVTNLGRTIGRVFSGIANAIEAFFPGTIAAITAFWENVKSVFTGAVDWIAGIPARIGNALSGMWDSITGAIGDFAADPFGAIRSAFENGISWLAGLPGRAIDAVAGFMDGILGALGFDGNPVSDAWEAIKTQFSDAIDWLAGIPGRAYDAIAGLWDSITGGISDSIGDPFESVREVFNDATDWLSEIPERAVEAISNLWHDIVSLFDGFSEDPWGTIRDMFDAAIDWLRAFPARAGDAILSILETIWSTLGGGEGQVRAAWERIYGAFESAISFIASLPSRFAALVGSIVDAFWSALSQLGARVRQVWDDVRSAFQSGIDYLRSIPERMLQAGRDILDGLIGGLRERIGAVRDTVGGIARSVSNWFQNPLEIFSPSRLFMRFGHYLMDGLQHGIDHGAEGPLVSMRRMVDRLRSAAAITLPAPAFESPRAPRMAAPIIAGLAATGIAVPSTVQASILTDLPDLSARLVATIENTPQQPAPPAERRATVPATAFAPLRIDNINIYAQPGQSAEDIAAAVRAELERAQREAAARARSSFEDGQ